MIRRTVNRTRGNRIVGPPAKIDLDFIRSELDSTSVLIHRIENRRI
jgi:hypothetical protein